MRRFSTRSAPPGRCRAGTATTWRPCPTSGSRGLRACGRWPEDGRGGEGLPKKPLAFDHGRRVRAPTAPPGLRIERVRVRPLRLARHALAERVALVLVG